MLNEAEIDHQKDEKIKRLEESNKNLKQRIKWLEKALFGPRSERIIHSDDNQGEFEDLLAELEALGEELEQDAPAPKKKSSGKRKKRRPHSELIPEHLPREEIIIDVPEEERTCPETGIPFKRMGEEISEKLAFRPGSYYVKKIIRPKYSHPKDPSYGVLIEPMIPSAICGSSFDESFTAGIGVDKCAYHLPLYRQQEKMKHAGIDVSRQTLSSHYMKGAEVLEPVFELMKSKMLEGQYIFTDDTPIQLQVKGKGKTVTGRMWIYVAGGTAPAYRLFDFTIDRKKEHPLNFLKNFKGYIHADAYSGYNELFQNENVTECGCWMHVRRKFFEAEDAPGKIRETILRLIRNLYRYEAVISNADPEFRSKIRKEKIQPIVEEIFDYAKTSMEKNNILPRSKIAGAFTYLFNQKEALKVFLTDPYIKPDNGTSERAIRPLAIGRKNWMFAGSQNGGKATAIWLSLIQTCRIMEIDPFVYLDDVLRRINSTENLEDLLPDQWKIDHMR